MEFYLLPSAHYHTEDIIVKCELFFFIQIESIIRIYFPSQSHVQLKKSLKAHTEFSFNIIEFYFIKNFILQSMRG